MEGVARSAGEGSRARVQIALVAFAGALAAAAVGWGVSESALPHAGGFAVLRAFTVVSLIGVACLIWWQRPANRFGPLLAALGFAFASTALTAASDPTVFTLGRVAVAAMWVLVTYVFLSFPHGVIEDSRARPIPAIMAGLTLALWVPLLLLADRAPAGGPFVRCSGECPDNPFQVLEVAPWVTSALSLTANVVIGAGLLVTALALTRRLRRATRLERRTVAPPLMAMSGLLLAGVPYVLLLEAGVDGPAVDVLRGASIVSTVVVPYALLLGMIRGQVFAGAAIRRLISRLGAERPTPARVRTMLAETLQDPTLDLAFWLEDRQRYVDAQGKLVVVPPSDPGRAVTLVGANGSPLAAMLHDPALDDHPELLEAASAAALLSLKNARLEADLRASVRDLRESRARVLSAADTERRRLERDLHDGAQQQFVALRMKLGLAAELLDDHEGKTARMLDEISHEAESALESLRELVHGVYPSLLIGHGLGEALAALARESPLRVRLDADGIGRFTPDIEAAVYFCCLEAVQNASKHAGAGATLDIRLRRSNGRLSFEVADRGAGFDIRSARHNGGSGLANMRDRIGAAGGEIDIESTLGSGTTVSGRLPV
jgi:signal transduction histidine kinase